MHHICVTNLIKIVLSLSLKLLKALRRARDTNGRFQNKSYRLIFVCVVKRRVPVVFQLIKQIIIIFYGQQKQLNS